MIIGYHEHIIYIQNPNDFDISNFKSLVYEKGF